MVKNMFYTIMFFLMASIPAAEGPSTYDIVLSGKTCKEGNNQSLSCEYRIGIGLYFSIDGIGYPEHI